MFGVQNRSARLKKIIDQEMAKLKDDDDAKKYLAVLHSVVVVKGNQGGFIPVSDADYEILTEGQKSDDNHKKRRDYILSRQTEYVLINRPASEKITDWIQANKGMVSALGVVPLGKYYIENKDAVDHFAHSFAPYLNHFISFFCQFNETGEFTGGKDRSANIITKVGDGEMEFDLAAMRVSLLSGSLKPEDLSSLVQQQPAQGGDIEIVQGGDIEILRYLEALPEDERNYLFNLSEVEESEDGVIPRPLEEEVLELLRQAELGQNNETGRSDPR